MRSDDFKPPLFEDLTPKTPAKTQEIIPPAKAESSGKVVESFDLTPFSKHKGIPPEHDVRNIVDKQKDFKNSEFITETSLLTNAEQYSDRVRQEADSYSRKVRQEADLIKTQIELDRGKQEIIIQEAKDEAARILAEAQKQKAQVFEDSSQKGYAAGFEQGKADHAEENIQLTARVFDLLKEIKDLRLHAAEENEEQLIQLALLAAQKIIQSEVAERKELVLNMLKKHLHRFEGMGRVKIRVNPMEYDFIVAHQPDLKQFLESQQEISFLADQAVAPASAMIESSYAEVNLDLAKQLKEGLDALTNCHEYRRPLFLPKYGTAALDPEDVVEESFTPELSPDQD